MERKTALELLEPSRFDDVNFLSKHWGPIAFSSIAGISVVMANLALRRPLVSGIHRYAILIPGAGFLGQWLQDYRDGKLAMKDAILRDYIKMHPEHFELPPREKFGEVFKNWVPMR